MFAACRRVRKRVQALPDKPNRGVREALLEWLDSDLRGRLNSIYTRHLPLEPRYRHLGVFKRNRVLAEGATSALRNAGAANAESGLPDAARHRETQ